LFFDISNFQENKTETGYFTESVNATHQANKISGRHKKTLLKKQGNN
jgi:hypothetical protein